jgi:hypothetical protein
MSEDKKDDNPFMKTISMATYQPTGEALNRSLHGQDKQPTKEDRDKHRGLFNEELRRLREGRAKEIT